MEGLVEITDKNKTTALDLIVYEHIDRIDSLANKWFIQTFIEKNQIPQDIAVRNLTNNLDYIFSMAVWFIELAESMNYTLEAKKSLVSRYEKYTNNPNGYRFLVIDHRYDRKQNRVLSEKEITNKQKRMDKVMLDIINKMNAEKK